MEIMVVIVLIGLLAGATAIAVFSHLAKGRDKATRIAAHNLRNAATSWRMDHPDECPTGAGLREAHLVDRAASIDDAWGSPLGIVCEANDITIVSFGPDRRESTEDDLRIPPPT